MSDDAGWRPGDDGHHGPDFGSSSSSSRSVPIYVLFLIMLGSGIITLVFLWMCVQCFYYRRRVRRARADLERNAAAGDAADAWDADTPAPEAAKDGAADVKRCDAGDVELTYVVMAGEDKPTFLAKPLKSPLAREEPNSPLPSPPECEPLSENLEAPAVPDKTSAS